MLVLVEFGLQDVGFWGCLSELKLGYRVAAVQDNDKTPTAALVDEFKAAGGHHVAWRDGRALEDELFASLPDSAVEELIERALELTEDGKVDENIKTKSDGKITLDQIRFEGLVSSYSPETRALLGAASRSRKSGWFKSISKMEAVARDILGPHFDATDGGFRNLIVDLFEWASDA